MKHVRAVFDQLVARDEEPAKLCFDLVLTDSDRIAHEIPYPGWWGTPRSNKWLCPLVLQPNGIVNFGGDAGENGCCNFELYDETVRVGLELYMRDFTEGKSHRFRLSRVLDLETQKDVA